MNTLTNSYKRMSTKISYKSFVLLFVIGITWLVSACQISSKSPESTLQSILASDTGCVAPCWRSLQPGLSNEEAFLNLVEVSDPRLFNDIGHRELNPEGIEYAWGDREFDIFSRVRIYEGQIQIAWLSTTQ